MEKFSRDFDLQGAMALANSPAGQQLLAALKGMDDPAMAQAAQKAAAGDMTGAKESLSALLADPNIQKLLANMGR